MTSLGALLRRVTGLLISFQVLETAVGIGVIGLLVKGWQPFPEDVFRLSLKCAHDCAVLPISH